MNFIKTESFCVVLGNTQEAKRTQRMGAIAGNNATDRRQGTLTA